MTCLEWDSCSPVFSLVTSLQIGFALAAGKVLLSSLLWGRFVGWTCIISMLEILILSRACAVQQSFCRESSLNSSVIVGTASCAVGSRLGVVVLGLVSLILS